MNKKRVLGRLKLHLTEKQAATKAHEKKRGAAYHPAKGETVARVIGETFPLGMNTRTLFKFSG